MDVLIDGDRIGADFRGQGREWLPFSEIRRLERHGDIWSVMFDRVGLDIPASLIDARIAATSPASDRS
jgi:hypothetical protein